MAFKPDQKVTFEPLRVLQPIYTGGPVALSREGDILAACVGEDVQITALQTGEQLARIEGDGEPVTAIVMTPDAKQLIICSRSASMRWYNLEQLNPHTREGQPQLSRTFKPHATPVVTACVDHSGVLLATGASDGVIKVWDLRGGYTTHTFHGHQGLVSALHFYRATSSTKNRNKARADDQLNGDGSDYRLASGDEDGRIRVWDLHKRKCLAVLESHASIVRSLAYDAANDLLASASRDRTVILWSASTLEIRQTVPIMEAVESAGFLFAGRFFYTAGERGRLRIWNTTSGAESTTEQDAGVETDAILQVFSTTDDQSLITIHADQVLRVHATDALRSQNITNIPPLLIVRQLSGTHDEIIDLAYVGGRGDLLALATNLEEIRLVSVQDTPGAHFGADVATLKGHDDIVVSMSVDWSGCWLATGAKDNTARLWRLDSETSTFECYTTFTGHTESIGAIALPNSIPTKPDAVANPLATPPPFLLTGSSDTTIKKWDIVAGQSPARAKWTRKAHDKDINALATSYSPSAPLAASASQDKTVRIWDIESGEAIAVLRGHKRGVWTVAFSPLSIPALPAAPGGGAASGSRGMVLTGSGDKTVRLWSLTDYSCIRTFEGHANSVLKTVWLPYGTEAASNRVQVASAAGDGLVKVWDANSGECAATLDNHIDRVWSLAVHPDLTQRTFLDQQPEKNDTATSGSKSAVLVSGSADSTMTFWIDSTETTAKQANERATAKIEQDQELQNHIRASNYREAIVLALQLNHPRRLLELFTTVINGEHEEGSLVGKHSIDEVLASLSSGQLWMLLQRCRDWNANARTYHVAQHIIWALLHLYSKEQLLRLGPKRKGKASNTEVDLASAMTDLTTGEERRSKADTPKDLLDALKAYTERHDQRLAKLGEEKFVLTWALQSMDGLGISDVAMWNGT